MTVLILRLAKLQGAEASIIKGGVDPGKSMLSPLPRTSACSQVPDDLSWDPYTSAVLEN